MMKYKPSLIIMSVTVILSVGCASMSPTPTPKSDMPITAAPTSQPTPIETIMPARTIAPTAPSSQTLVPTMSPTPPQGGVSNMNTPTPTPSSSEAEQIVLQAKQDLAKQLAISIDQITLVEVREITWPDSSLGCPQPGMMYLQVLIDGYLIRLRAGERIYEYHSGGNRPPFLCQTKS